MEVHFMPELEEKLNRVASESGRPADQAVQELVKTYIDHDQWFREEVKKGLAQLDRGEFIEHDEVVGRIERLFHSLMHVRWSPEAAVEFQLPTYQITHLPNFRLEQSLIATRAKFLEPMAWPPNPIVFSVHSAGSAHPAASGC